MSLAPLESACATAPVTHVWEVNVVLYFLYIIPHSCWDTQWVTQEESTHAELLMLSHSCWVNNMHVSESDLQTCSWSSVEHPRRVFLLLTAENWFDSARPLLSHSAWVDSSWVNSTWVTHWVSQHGCYMIWNASATADTRCASTLRQELSNGAIIIDFHNNIVNNYIPRTVCDNVLRWPARRILIRALKKYTYPPGSSKVYFYF